MGDVFRNKKFGKFICEKYPKEMHPSVFVVADGNFELSKILNTYGYDVTAFEPKPRRKNMSIRFKREVKIRRMFFERSMKMPEPHLIVGMHPDEATVEILLYAAQRKIPYAVVPCCVKGDRRYTATVKNYKHWLDVLKRIVQETVGEHKLNINGKNIILYDVKHAKGDLND